MKTLRIAQAALALTLIVGISSHSFAFMVEASGPSILKRTTPAQLVTSLRAELDAGETKCEDMLVKLNSALDEIDARLDAGVPNEDEYLAARQQISEMRHGLECVANTLTAQIVGGGAAAAGAAAGAGAAPVATGFGAAGAAGGGMAGAGVGAAAGGTSLGSLAGLGIVGGGVAAVTSNSDAPGFVASEALAN